MKKHSCWRECLYFKGFGYFAGFMVDKGYLLSRLTKTIKKTCDISPQLSDPGDHTMTVTVTERDEAHLSHEAIGHGIHIWDVRQQDQLVGMFHDEADAQRYKQELEALEEQAQHNCAVVQQTQPFVGAALAAKL